MSSNILVSSSVSASAIAAEYSISTAHPKNETVNEAINIGNLNEQSVIVSITDDGAVATTAVSTSFVSKGGTVSLSQAIDSLVDVVFTRFQLMDSEGTIIADSDGAGALYTAYSDWVDGTLSISAGTYTVTATPDTEFTGDIALTINASELQGTSLQVDSALTGSDTSEYYNFSLAGTNIKLDFDAGRNSGDTRVILYDDNYKIIADSSGNSYQRSQYLAMTSGTGLASASGDYTILVTYSDTADMTQDVDYTFRLYSGNSYAAVYTTTAKAQPYDGSAKGSVEAASDALLYEASAYNKINTNASKAINVGWLQQDKSMLDVFSMLTSADNTNFYIFTLQQGNNLKFDFNASTTQNEAGIRVQLLDGSGSYVYADSGGTTEQRARYEMLTSSTGIDAKTGNYVIKITYADGVDRNNLQYEFGVYSGSAYAAQYKTIASAQTYGNAILTSELGGSSAASAGIAAYLSAQMNEDEDYLSTKLSEALKTLY
ncbi:MAG: hypothetical protein WC521_00575 [Bdellovibrionales bacterium]